LKAEIVIPIQTNLLVWVCLLHTFSFEVKIRKIKFKFPYK
jgi:hypothetical protein